MAIAKTLTPDQLKANFERDGKTFADWAREHGYTVNEVYRVTNGFAKAKRGKAHEIAVALGLKADSNQRAA
jgi:gp16 family phage-associated protein